MAIALMLSECSRKKLFLRGAAFGTCPVFGAGAAFKTPDFSAAIFFGGVLKRNLQEAQELYLKLDHHVEKWRLRKLAALGFREGKG